MSTSWYKTFRYELRPSSAQAKALTRMAGGRRFVFNWALEQWRLYYAVHGASPPRPWLYRELTRLKRAPGFEWLNELDSHALQQAIRDLEHAYRAFFEGRARYPRFKSRKRDPLRFRAMRARIVDDRIQVPRIGWIRLRLSREVTGRIKSATYKRAADGRWFVLVLTEHNPGSPPELPADHSRVVGVDLGVIRFAVLSDGTEVASPRFAAAAERKERLLRRQLARRQPGSRNRARARRSLARLHARTAARRQDFLHKLTTNLIRRYDGICLETLDARGLARTKVSKSVLDAAFGDFADQVKYKAMWAEKPVGRVGRFFPSSKTCGRCGLVNHALARSDRVWTCECGATHDRDLNAAQNIRAEGLRLLVAAGHADTENACGAQVSPPMEAQDEEAGIPVGECQTGSILVIEGPPDRGYTRATLRM